MAHTYLPSKLSRKLQNSEKPTFFIANITVALSKAKNFKLMFVAKKIKILTVIWHRNGEDDNLFVNTFNHCWQRLFHTFLRIIEDVVVLLPFKKAMLRKGVCILRSYM